MKILPSNLVYVLFVSRFTTYIPFFGGDNSKNFEFYRYLLLKNRIFDFGLPKKQSFVERSILRLLAFWITLYFKPVYSKSLQSFAAFDPIWRNMTSLKQHFPRSFPRDFSNILLGDVKLMPDKVLNIFASLSSFLSYSENTVGEGGNIFPQWGVG